LVRRAAAERGCDFSDVRIGLLRNLDVVKDAISESAATSKDIKRLLYDAAAPLS